MIERKDLNLDPILTDRFFAGKSEHFQEDVDFPLPKDKDDLRTFLAGPNGKTLRERVSELMRQVFAWGREKGVNHPAAEDKLFKEFNTYDGTNLVLNEDYILLFREGSVALFHIAKLLHRPEIPDSHKCDTLRNMFAEVFLCITGTAIHLVSAREALEAKTEATVFFRNERGKLLDEILMEIIKRYEYHPGNQIHYGAVLRNYYSEALNVTTIEDKTIAKSDQTLIETLKTASRAQLSTLLTANAFVDSLVARLQLENHINRINAGGNYLDITEELEAELAFYGPDNQKYAPLNNLLYSDDELIKHWQAEYLLHASITERLKTTGYFTFDFNDSSMINVKGILGHKVIIYPNHHLNFSRIIVDNNPQSLLLFLTNTLYRGTVIERATLWLFLRSNHLCARQKFELAIAILKFYQFEKKTNGEALTIPMQTILEDVSSLVGENFYIKILEHMPSDILLTYFSVNVEPFLQSIYSIEDVAIILNTLPPEKIIDLLLTDMINLASLANVTENGLRLILLTKRTEVRELLFEVYFNDKMSPFLTDKYRNTIFIGMVPPKYYLAMLKELQRLYGDITKDVLFFVLNAIPAQHYFALLNCFMRGLLNTLLIDKTTGVPGAINLLEFLFEENQLALLTALQKLGLLTTLTDPVFNSTNLVKLLSNLSPQLYSPLIKLCEQDDPDYVLYLVDHLKLIANQFTDERFLALIRVLPAQAMQDMFMKSLTFVYLSDIKKNLLIAEVAPSLTGMTFQRLVMAYNGLSSPKYTTQRERLYKHLLNQMVPQQIDPSSSLNHVTNLAIWINGTINQAIPSFLQSFNKDNFIQFMQYDHEGESNPVVMELVSLMTSSKRIDFLQALKEMDLFELLIRPLCTNIDRFYEFVEMIQDFSYVAFVTLCGDDPVFQSALWKVEEKRQQVEERRQLEEEKRRQELKAIFELEKARKAQAKKEATRSNYKDKGIVKWNNQKYADMPLNQDDEKSKYMEMFFSGSGGKKMYSIFDKKVLDNLPAKEIKREFKRVGRQGIVLHSHHGSRPQGYHFLSKHQSIHFHDEVYTCKLTIFDKRSGSKMCLLGRKVADGTSSLDKSPKEEKFELYEFDKFLTKGGYRK